MSLWCYFFCKRSETVINILPVCFGWFSATEVDDLWYISSQGTIIFIYQMMDVWSPSDNLIRETVIFSICFLIPAAHDRFLSVRREVLLQAAVVVSRTALALITGKQTLEDFSRSDKK